MWFDRDLLLLAPRRLTAACEVDYVREEALEVLRLELAAVVMAILALRDLV